MARYRRRRFYKRRTHYSPNITRIGPSSFNIPAQSRDIGIVTLIENQVYDPARSNNIITVKNPELSIEFESPSNYIESCTAYLLFIPEGYTVNLDTPIQHPEWIMAYKYFGSPNYDTNTYVNDTRTETTKYINKIKTRLSRKLNTGDRIVLLVEGTNADTANQHRMEYQGLCRWFTKAN